MSCRYIKPAMLTFNEIAGILDEIVRDTPEEFMSGLQGVYLMPEIKYSEKIPDGRHLIMGEYIRTPMFGQVISQIHVYYGSVMERHLDDGVNETKLALETIFRHELRHHVEHMAGNDDLGDEDRAYIARERARVYPGTCPETKSPARARNIFKFLSRKNKIK